MPNYYPGSYDLGFTVPDRPATPTDLVATPISKTQIDLSWTDNSSDETLFSIERDGIEIATVAADEVTYSDTGLTEGTTYHYRIRALRDTTYSLRSNEVTVSTLPHLSLHVKDTGFFQDFDLTVPASDTDPMGGWQDQGPYHHDFKCFSSGSFPILSNSCINSLPAVRFDGSNDHLDCTALDSVDIVFTKFSFSFAGRIDNETDIPKGPIFIYGAVVDVVALDYYKSAEDSSYNIRLLAGNEEGTHITATAVLPQNPNYGHVLAVIYDGAGETPADNFKVYFNGTQLTLNFEDTTVIPSLALIIAMLGSGKGFGKVDMGEFLFEEIAWTVPQIASNYTTMERWVETPP